MKRFKNLFALMFILTSVFFFACSDDDEKTVSPEEAKVELENLTTDMSTYLEEMVNSKGMEAMDVLMAMPDPFTDTKSTGRTSVVSNIKKYLLPVNPEKTKSTFEAEPFDFDTWVGTYTWDIVHEMWIPEFGTPSDKIILIFPTEESVTNDAILTIHNYDEVNIAWYDDYYETYENDYYPTDISADLYVNTVKIVEIDLSATWITTGDNAGEPKSFDISVYLSPFTFSGSFDHGSTSASIDFAIKYNSEKIFSAGVNASFMTSDMEDPKTVGGYVQLLNVKVEADIDVQSIDAIFNALDEGTSTYTTMDELIAAVNKEIDAVVYIDGAKAADIELQYSNLTQEMDVVFVFTDGSTEPALPYFEDFSSNIGDFFYFLDDVYGDW